MTKSAGSSPATVAGVYAQALLQIAAERGDRAAVVESARDLVASFDLRSLGEIDDPRVGKTKAKSAICGVLKGRPKSLVDLFQLLIDRNRLMDVPAILREVVRQAEAADGVVQVRVTAAKPVPAQATARLAAVTGGHAQIDVAVDPALIGGVAIRVGDTLVDASVRRQLREMRQAMLNTPIASTLWAS
ncbi:MAG: ATP synthase F1 subunit delta [Planctomycetota bacterium]